MLLKINQISRKFILLLSTALFCNTYTLANAASLNYQFTSQIPQGDYDNIVQPIVNASRFQFMTFPGASAGRLFPLSISAGIGVTYLDVPNSTKTSLSNYTNGSSDYPSSVIIPRFIGQIGIPFGLDISFNYAKIPNSDIELSGIGLQYAFKPKVLPLSFALRVGYTQIANYSPFTASSTNAEALMGLSIPFLKPYIGGGANWSNANTSADFTSNGTTVHVSQNSSWTQFYGIAGLYISLIPFIGIDLNAQLSDAQTLYNAKLSLDI